MLARQPRGATIEDTPRNRCLEFIKYLVRWENSNNPEYIDPAKKLIAAAHKFLHPGAESEAPRVLDPFAGGGAILLEALRLGCEAHAVDLNPVAHLIELCTLVYPQKYGQTDSRPVPDYIERLIAHNRAKKNAKSGKGLFDDSEHDSSPLTDGIIPDVDITEAEYRKNPLAADVKYWGHWVLERARNALSAYYRNSSRQKPLAYVWARTVPSPDPSIKAEVPLVSSLWLSKKAKASVALRMLPDAKAGKCQFEVVTGREIDFDPDRGTISRGQLQCPLSGVVMQGDDLRQASEAGRMRHQMIAVVEESPSGKGKSFRSITPDDITIYEAAASASETFAASIPREPITEDRPSPNSGGLSAFSRYGIDELGKLFSPRQALALCQFAPLIHDVHANVARNHDEQYSIAVADLQACAFSRLVDQSSTLVRWLPLSLAHRPGRQRNPARWRQGEATQAGAAEPAGEAGAGARETVLNRDGAVKVNPREMTMTTLHGVIHGKTIELEQEPGLAEGQRVAVDVRVLDEPPAWLQRLVVDPAVNPAKLVIQGTRLLVDDLVRLVHEGRSDQHLRQLYPELTPADVEAIRNYSRVPEGLRGSFGGWAEDAEELDQYLEWNRQQRKLSRREIEE